MGQKVGQHVGRVAEYLVGCELDRPHTLGDESPVADRVVRALAPGRMGSMARDLDDEQLSAKEEVDSGDLFLVATAECHLALGFREVSGPDQSEESSFETRCHRPTHGPPIEYLVEQADIPATAAAQDRQSVAKNCLGSKAIT